MDTKPKRRLIATTRLGMLVEAMLLIAVGCAFGAWIVAQADTLTVDQWWNGVIARSRSSVLDGVSLFMNFVGGGWFAVYVLPLAVALALLLARRRRAALFFIVASIVSAPVIQLLKQLFSRDRPPELLIVTDFGSYPSGHVANAATIAVVIFLIFRRLWVAVAGLVWVLLMAFTRTYLHAHWVSDTLGGALIGAGAALVVAAGFIGVTAAQVRMPEQQTRHRIRGAPGAGPEAAGNADEK